MRGHGNGDGNGNGNGNVLVTGASTGIGEATARRLDRAGWRVFAGVRKEDDGRRLQAAASPRLTPVLLDVTDELVVAQALDDIAAAIGPTQGLDGLVNNAGVARGGPIEFLPLAEWRDQLEVNLLGQVAVTKAALPLVRRAKGRIVFVGSIAGRVATPLVAPYAASKHAVEALAAALREELRPWGIGVSVIEPGVIRTPIWGKASEKADELEASLGEDAMRLYRDQFDAVRASIVKNDARGTEAATVAEVVERALSSSRPRPRYLVGTDAKVAGNLVRVVPDRLWVTLSRRLLAL